MQRVDYKESFAERVRWENWEKEEVHERLTIDGVVVEDKDGNLNARAVKVKRNPKWKKLDWDYIEEAVGHVSRFEYVMCENQCKDEDISIKAILKSRKADEDLEEYLAWHNRTTKRERYIRSHYNDLEDDNYERQEKRVLNG